MYTYSDKNNNNNKNKNNNNNKFSEHPFLEKLIRAIQKLLLATIYSFWKNVTNFEGNTHDTILFIWLEICNFAHRNFIADATL